jgi:hypothetical protein
VLPDEQQAELADRFERFANETAGSSPLYAALCHGLAARPEAASVLLRAPRRQQRPNLLLAAVHDLLLTGLEHPLAAYYPSVGGARPVDGEAVGTLLDLLDGHAEAVAARIATRSTQTNEVGRCAALWPAVHRIAAADDRPLALVELGASAGLLLHLDRYRYDLGGQGGDPDAAVRIAPTLRGPVPAVTADVRIDSRVGIDLAPLDASDEDDARWLCACVWPEETARLERLRAALGVAAHHADVELRTGDLVRTLPSTLAQVPDDHLPCVLHSATLAYLGAEDRQAVTETLAEVGRERDLARISLEGPFLPPFDDWDERQAPDDPPYFVLGLTTWVQGRRRDELLGRLHPHGAWLRWFLGEAG